MSRHVARTKFYWQNNVCMPLFGCLFIKTYKKWTVYLDNSSHMMHINIHTTNLQNKTPAYRTRQNHYSHRRCVIIVFIKIVKKKRYVFHRLHPSMLIFDVNFPSRSPFAMYQSRRVPIADNWYFNTSIDISTLAVLKTPSMLVTVYWTDRTMKREQQ